MVIRRQLQSRRKWSEHDANCCLTQRDEAPFSHSATVLQNFGVEISLLQRRDLLLARLPAVMLNAALCHAETSPPPHPHLPPAPVKVFFSKQDLCL